MTPEEIRLKPVTAMSAESWLREIALQLALLNESKVIETRKPPKQPRVN